MKCPECGAECECDTVDNGVGMERCGPWGCPQCHWVEEDISEKMKALGIGPEDLKLAHEDRRPNLYG